MFSTNAKKGDPFAIVVGGKDDEEIIYLKTDTEKTSVVQKKPVTEIAVHDGMFELMPDPRCRIIYIAGPQNSGKSFFAGQYIEKYRLMYPKAKFYVFSRLSNDPSLDHLVPHRITIDQSIVDNPIELEEIPEHSVCLFDDIDNVSDKNVQHAVNKIKEQIMEIGRHRDVKCVITSHLINGNQRSVSRITLNEMQVLVIFPQSGSGYQIKYVLKHYFDLSVKQVNKIMDMKHETRWVALVKIHPQVLLTQHRAVFLNSL